MSCAGAIDVFDPLVVATILPMMQLDLVDVFGSAPLRGNPLGVVHGASGLGAESMQEIARWLGRVDEFDQA